MGVDQTGQQHAPGAVHDREIIGGRQRSSLGDRLDPVARHEHVPIALNVGAVEVFDGPEQHPAARLGGPGGDGLQAASTSSGAAPRSRRCTPGPGPVRTPPATRREPREREQCGAPGTSEPRLRDQRYERRHRTRVLGG
jgi:hypothetical protein